MKKSVWLEINTSTGLKSWQLPAFERYLGVGFNIIVTTSPGRDYVNSIYGSLPEYVLGGFKLSNALTSMDDVNGWKRVREGIEAFVFMRQELQRKLGIEPTTIPIIFECETLLNKFYWNSSNYINAKTQLCDGLKSLTDIPGQWIFYPAFGEDLGISGWTIRLDNLIRGVKKVLPGVRFTDNEYAYQPPNPTWSDQAAALRIKLAGKATNSLVYTNTFDRPNNGFYGWKPEQLPDLFENMRIAKRNAYLYPGSSQAAFTAPLSFLEAVSS